MRNRPRAQICIVVRYMFNEYFVYQRPISKMHPSMSNWLGLNNSHFDLKVLLLFVNKPCIDLMVILFHECAFTNFTALFVWDFTHMIMYNVSL